MSHGRIVLAAVSIAVFICCSGSINPVQATADTWASMNAMGMKAYRQGRYADAKQWFLQALNELEATEEPSPRRAMTLNNLAAVNEALGEYEKAEIRYRQSLAIIEAIQGPTHPDLISSLNNLASLYQRQGQLERAEPLWRRSLSILERFLGDQHPHLIPLLLVLAESTEAQGRVADADALYARALHIAESQLASNHAQTATILLRYANFLRNTNRADEALLLEERARAIQNQSSPSKP